MSSLDLPELPVLDADFTADPEPFMAVARRQHPWLAKCPFGYIVHGYHAIKAIMPQDDKLRPAMDGIVKLYGGQDTAWGRFQQSQILGRHGDEHLRIRNAIAASFQPKNVKHLRSLIQTVATDLLDEWAPKGGFDFTEFASHFPVTVLCALLGTSPEPIPRIRKALEAQAQVTSLDPRILPDLLAAFDVLWEFVDTLIIEREKSGLGDEGALLDVIIAAKNDGTLSETEIRDLLIVLFVAGYGTSKTLVSVAMHRMLSRPDDWRRCAQDVNFCTKVVEESLRHTSVANATRLVSHEIEYDGVVFPEGTMLIFGLSKAGRDPDAFSDALAFEPERVFTNRHISFGRGAHLCLGQHLARLQISEGLHLMAQRLIDPVATGEVVWRPFFTGGGPKSLPIAFETA